MKKKRITRLLCALLIFLLLFSLLSCQSREGKVTYKENSHFEIVSEEITYSESFMEHANTRFTNLATIATEAYFDIHITETQKQHISESFTTTFLPIFYRIKIYEEELDRMLSAAEENIGADKVLSPLALYESALYNLGSRRSGMLFFELSLITVKDKEETARRRYLQYGEKRYLEDAERCAQLIASLSDMGEDRFIEALSATALITSTAFSLNRKNEENAFLLEDAELLYLLDRQAKGFLETCPTDAEWQTVGALINELIPLNASNLPYATMYALKNEGYFHHATRIMPSVLSLYASVAASLKEAATFSLNGEKAENTKAILSALKHSEQELRALDASLILYAKTDSERLKHAVEANAEQEELKSFLNAYTPIDCDQLLSTIRQASENEETALTSAVISYVAGVSPYLAFVLFH